MVNKKSESTVVDFASASSRFKKDKDHDRKDAKVEEMRERFKAALPDKKTPVKDFLKKKKAKKKR